MSVKKDLLKNNTLADEKQGFLDETGVVFDLVLNSKNINVQNDDGETPLYVAVSSGYHKLVELLLKHEAIKVNLAESYHGDTPLHSAARDGYTESVRHLVKAKGLDINAQNINGETALYLAA